MTNHQRNQLLLACIGAVLFIPFLGSAQLFDWDEINFAESAREMLVTGDYFRVQINYQPFWEKPPLFFWMQAASMSVFGVNEFAARLPNALCGIASLVVLYSMGSKLYDARFGWLWALAYLGSVLPHFYFKSGIIDPVFNLFIFTGIYFLSTAAETVPDKRWRVFFIAGAWIGLGVLTKGPVAYLVATLVLFVFAAVKKLKSVVSVSEFLIYTASAGAVALVWYGTELVLHGAWFIEAFLSYQAGIFSSSVAGHGQPWYYHIVVLFFGVFPSSMLAFGAFGKREADSEAQQNFKLWMTIFFFVVLTIFSAATTKIVHYSSLCYFPLTYFGAYTVYHAAYHSGTVRFIPQGGELAGMNVKWKGWLTALVAVVGLLVASALTLLPLLVANKEWILPYIKDRLTLEVLKANGGWSGFEFLIGVFYAAAIVVSVRLLARRQVLRGAQTLFISTAVMLWLYMMSVVPKIAEYTQGANVRFYQGLQNEDCYVEVLNFKSYAHLFYLKKPPVTNPKSYDEQWLLNGDIDKPAYFVCKIIHADEFREKGKGKLIELREENGFVYFKRLP